MSPRKRRPVPEWKLIWQNLLEQADYGRVVTYPELDRVLGRPFINNRSPIYKARAYMGRLRRRWLEAMPGIGYRVIDAAEHLRVADDHKARGRRQLHRMQEVTNSTDIERLTPLELSKFDIQTRINATLITFVNAHEQRLNRIEAILRHNGMLDDEDEPPQTTAVA